MELVRLSGPVSVSQASAIALGDIKGYMTGKYNAAWWLGYVTETDPSMQEVTVTFLHPHGPSRGHFTIQASTPDILTSVDLLTSVNPNTSTGRCYTTKEMDAATKALYITHLNTYCKYTNIVCVCEFFVLVNFC